MTEIPEHLLKRSRERRSAMGGAPEGGDAAPSATPAVAAPAAAAPAKAAAPAPVAPKAAAPKPDPAYITAAKTRKKMPFWAMGALSMLPLWAFLYVRGVQPKEVVVEGPMAVGAEAYGGCAGCHQANGSGGAGRPFWNGEVLKTFPHIEDQINFVYNGSIGYQAAGIATYGDPDREGGAHAPYSFGVGGMPAQGATAGGALTDLQILGVVCHERYALGGADPGSEEWAEEYEKWCSPEAEMFLLLEEGESFADEAFAAVGEAARPSIGGAEG